MSSKAASLLTNQNRIFGLVMASGLGGLVLIRFLWAGTITWWLVALAALFLASGLLVPWWLGPIRAGWMKFAMVLGHMNTRLLLTVLFAGLIVPLAVLLRLIGKQPISFDFRDGSESYWRRRTADEFSAKQMERQF